MAELRVDPQKLAEIKARNAAGIPGNQTLYGAATLYRSVNETWEPLSQNIFHPGGCWCVLLGINPQHPPPPKLNPPQRSRHLPPVKPDPIPDPGRGYFWNLAAKRGHGLCFSTTGGGKNTNIITPALLSYNGSILCLDPKGENAWITADRRRMLGQRVVILDPWDQVNKSYASKFGAREQISRFNPLASLDPKSPDFNDDVTSIADGIIIVSEKSDPHWGDSASQLVSGLIAAVVEQAPGVASIRDVRRLITSTDGELLKVIDKVVARDPNSLAARKLRRFAKASKEIISIRSTADTQTAIFDAAWLLDSMDNPDAQERTRTSMLDAAQMLGSMETMSTQGDAFDLSELATSRVTLYLVLPFGMLASHGRWMRLILQLALKAIARQPTPPNPPILFLLDELGTINPGGGLRMIEQAYGLLGGMGVRIFGFFQTLDQLMRDYPSTWQTFIGNSENICLMRVNDNGTSEYFSRKLGTYTQSTSLSGGSAPRPLLMPQEIDHLPENYVLTLRSGANPMLMETRPYYAEPRFNGLYRANPLHPLPAWDTAAHDAMRRMGTPFLIAGPLPAQAAAVSAPVPAPAESVIGKLVGWFKGGAAGPANNPPPGPAAVIPPAVPVAQPTPAPVPAVSPAPPPEPEKPFVMDGAKPYSMSVNLSIGKGKPK